MGAVTLVSQDEGDPGQAAATYNTTVGTGWTAVGFQCLNVTSLTNTTAVAGLAYWDGTTYQTKPLTVSELNAASTLRGFWLFSNSATTFSYGGNDDSGNRTMQLRSGWNLVAFPCPTTVAASSLIVRDGTTVVNLTTVILPQFYEIGADSRYTTVDVSQAGALLKGGKAYWTYASRAVSVSYTAGPAASPTPTPSPTATPITAVGTVSGQILNAATNTAIGSVNATLDNVTVVANEQGFFTLGNVTPGDARIIRLAKTGYLSTVQTVRVLGGQNTFLTVYMNAQGTTQTVNAQTGGSFQEPAGANVTLPPNALVTASGTPFTGTANLTIKTSLPSSPNYLESFPGQFLGDSSRTGSTTRSELLSYGLVTVTLTDASGNPLNLASGQNATLRIPVDPTNDPGKPTVPIWFLNETTGIYTDAGDATRSADNRFYVAQVSHFSTINLDDKLSDSATKNVTVTDRLGQPVANALVSVKCKNILRTGYTDTQGKISIIRIQPSVAIQVWAQKGTVKSAVISENAPGPNGVVENSIILDNPVASITLSWGAEPRDLDGHLNGPLAGGGTFDVDYRSHGSLNSSPYAFLDTDAQAGYGPEIITISRWTPGTYQYFVNLFRGTGTLQGSGLVVDLAVPSLGYIKRYSPPASNPSNANSLAVFEIVVSTGGNVTVRDVNTYVNSTNPAADK